MAFVRLTLVTPKPRQTDRVEILLTSLVQAHQARDGAITSYRLKPDTHSASGRHGCVSIWQTEEHANRMVSDQHDLALHAELKLVAEDPDHEEFSFEGIAAAVS